MYPLNSKLHKTAVRYREARHSGTPLDINRSANANVSPRQHRSHQWYNTQRDPCNYLNAELPISAVYNHILDSGNIRVCNNNS